MFRLCIGMRRGIMDALDGDAGKGFEEAYGIKNISGGSLQAKVV